MLTAMLHAEEWQPRIAPFQGDRGGAYSFTFDDGWKGQVENTLAIIDPIGIAGTFFVMPLAMERSPQSHASWDDLLRMQATGHEIGGHAKVRPQLHELERADLAEQIRDAHRLMVEHLDAAPVSFALPGGTQATDQVLEVVYRHYPFVRRPNTFPEVAQVISYGEAGRRKWRPERERDKIEAAIADGKWRIAVIHAIVKGYSPFPSKQAFREHCEWVHAQRDRLWVAPMGTVARYLLARREAELEVVERAAGSCTFRVEVPEEQRALCTEPLTIVLPVAAGTAEARTAEGETTATIREGAILVDVEPDGQPVTVTWTQP